VQIISMILTCTLTDRFGRRPLTVYPYGVTVLSVLALGIVGCFDYTQPSLSSLLVRPQPCSQPPSNKSPFDTSRSSSPASPHSAQRAHPQSATPTPPKSPRSASAPKRPAGRSRCRICWPLCLVSVRRS
jgi:hypothetical protein